MDAQKTQTDKTGAELVVGPPSSLPTDYGTFTLRAYTFCGVTHVAMTMVDPASSDAPLVRMHSECLTVHVLGSHRCDCGDQLTAAMQAISSHGTGIVLYLRGQEGRGIGLDNKLRAYALQDTEGLDTVEANRALGLPDDARDYRAAAEMLTHLGCQRIRLLSSNPAKSDALTEYGIAVTQRLNLQLPDRPENSAYLQSKRQRMNHDVPNGHPELDHSLELDVYKTLATHDEVVAQLAQSEDGFIASRTGDAEFVSGKFDRRHLPCIRAAVSCVMVGAGKVIALSLSHVVRSVEGENPVRVILDPRARIPRDATVLQSGAAPTLWLVGADIAIDEELADHVPVPP